MLTGSKWLSILAGFWLIIDSILIIGGIPNPLFGWPLPCPVALILLGLVILLFGVSSRVFELPSGRRGQHRATADIIRYHLLTV